MDEQERTTQIGKTVIERANAVRDLAAINARLTALGRRFTEIGKGLESGAPHGSDDPLLWQLRELSGDLADVLVAERLGALVGDRARLTKLVVQLNRYLRDMGIDPDPQAGG